MSFVIACPNCGPRPSTDFRYGGETRPAADPSASAEQSRPAASGCAATSRGWQDERWFHRDGCRRWLTITRHTDDQRDPPVSRCGSREPRDRVPARRQLASALFRSGVRTFSRCFKYHRRRGLYCLSGDCANCLLEVDGERDVRSCLCRRARRHDGEAPGRLADVERDLLRDQRPHHWAFPVGFYYKTLIKPSWAWPQVEPLIRQVAGRGRVNLTRRAPRSRARAICIPTCS